MALTENLILFRDKTKNREALIGDNVLPSSTGVAAVALFSNEYANPYGTNYGLQILVQNAANNIAIKTKGSISSDGYCGGYNYSKQDGSTSGWREIEYESDTVYLYGSSGVDFVLPNRSNVAKKLGITSDTPFSVKLTIIGHRLLSGSVQVYGRSSSVSGTNTDYYPYRLDYDAASLSGGINVAKGDCISYRLTYDGSYYCAYKVADVS